MLDLSKLLRANILKIKPFVYSMLILLALVACGGSGGPSTNTLSGTAATGAPIAGASIEVYNASGLKVATATTDSSGKYTTSALVGDGPYVVKGSSGSTELYSVQYSDDGSVVNLTPMSNLVATLLSPTGNASNLVSELGEDISILSTTRINDKKTIVKTIVSPVATAIGVSSDFDVINTAMDADGTGLDHVLDTVHISITHDSSTTSAIQVLYKTADGTSSSPQVITFSNTDSASNVILSVNGISYSSGDILDPEVMKKVLVWIKRDNDCNKIPATERWSGSVGSKVILSSTCKKLFYNNDSNTFKFNGYGAEAVFSILFGNRTSTSDVSTEAEYVYSTAQGDVLIKFKATLYNGDGTTFERFVFFNLTPDPNNNYELRAKGNGYDYEATVNSSNYIRYFPYSPGYDFTYSGYTIDIPTIGTRGFGSNAIIPYASSVKSAEVTPPCFSADTTSSNYSDPRCQKTYLYNTGLPQLSVCVSKPNNLSDAVGKCAASPLKIFRSHFFNPTTGNTAVPVDKSNLGRTRPAQYEGSGFVDYGPVNGQLTDAQIKNLPMIGTYKVQLTLADGSLPPVQIVPFYGRPKTHAEVIQAKALNLFPAFTTNFISSLFRSISDCPNGYGSCIFDTYKNVFPVNWNTAHDALIPVTFNAAWTGLAQWIQMVGIKVDMANSANNSRFEIRRNLSTTDTDRVISCVATGSVDPCYNNSTEFLSWLNSGYLSVFTYMEIGNYFSDFGIHITSYGFWNFEDDGLNPFMI